MYTNRRVITLGDVTLTTEILCRGDLKRNLYKINRFKSIVKVGLILNKS